MTSELGDLVCRKRLALGLTLQELAQMVGYRNRNKGARRLERLESEGDGEADLVARVAGALGLDAAEVAERQARDEATREAAFQEWLSVPQPMELYAHVVSVTFVVPLPEGLTEEQAIAYAREAQKRLRLRMCLVLDRRRSLWISPEGKSYLVMTTRRDRNFPYTTVD